jgi:peptidyl-prolyl cis-trans isomerase A (cyclophilin A)
MRRIMRRNATIFAVLIAANALAACSVVKRTPDVLSPTRLNREAPAAFHVLVETSAGNFTVEVQRAWAPRGADRFYNLVRAGFYDGARFFRVLPGFVVQFGLNGDPAVSAAWTEQVIPDDSVRASNVRGTIAFATSGPNTRTTQVFVNLVDNVRLDARGFSPFGRVISGMEVVEKLYADYGEGAPRGKGPDQDRIEKEGNAYLLKEYPKLDFVTRARIVR